MYELCARILLATTTLFGASAFEFVDFDLAWKAAVIHVALAVFGYRLEVNGLKNAGVAGFFAVADAFTIALLAASARSLSTAGFLVLVPVAYAIRCYGTNALHLAPLTTASILGSAAIFNGPILPPVPVLWQMAGVMAIGLLLSRPKVASIVAPAAVETLEREQKESDGFLELRESFRRLREAYIDLENRGRREKTAATLAVAREAKSGGFFTALTSQVAEVAGVSSLVLYTVSGYESSLRVRAVHGEPTEELSLQTLDVDVRMASSKLRGEADRAVSALAQEGQFGNVPLILAGRVVGLISIHEDNPSTLASARTIIEEASSDIANLIAEGLSREDLERRLREAELLYDLASLEEGALSQVEVARRFTRELCEIVQADHLAVWMLDTDGPICLARAGRDVRLLNQLSFAGGTGFEGWLKTGAPELLLFDVRSDGRCPSVEAIRSRVGSFFVLPIGDGLGIEGFITVATDRIGGLDLPQAPVVRTASQELSHALYRSQTKSGIMNPTEFRQAVATQTGAMVVIDPLRREEIAATYGGPALSHILRRLARRIHGRLPSGSLLCRRTEGDFVAFMPGVPEPFAQSWANELVSSASMIDLRTPDGSVKISVAIRAKVASIEQQNHQFSEELSA